MRAAQPGPAANTGTNDVMGTVVLGCFGTTTAQQRATATARETAREVGRRAEVCSTGDGRAAEGCGWRATHPSSPPPSRALVILLGIRQEFHNSHNHVVQTTHWCCAYRKPPAQLGPGRIKRGEEEEEEEEAWPAAASPLGEDC